MCVCMYTQIYTYIHTHTHIHTLVNWVVQDFSKSIRGFRLSILEAKILKKNWILAKSPFHSVLGSPGGRAVMNRD